MSLKKQTLNGVFWTFSQQFSVQIINFGVQIVLARLLLPEAFGLIAMLQIFMAIGQTLMDGGMTSSLIRTQNADQKDYSTVFFMNLFTSTLLYIILYFIAPFIAEFYKQPILTSIIRIYAITFLIQALVGVQTTLLTKQMKFKVQMFMQLPSVFIEGVVGLVLAYLDYGVWSLVWMNIIRTFLFMIQHWFKTDWRPSLIIDKTRLKTHFNFGYKLTLSRLITTIYFNSYNLIIGKFFSATQLGYYSQADTLRMFPVSNITSALQKVTYPMFSSIQDDDKRLKSVFQKITLQVFWGVVPLMIVLIIFANPLFRFLLTDKWLPAVPYFQVLCISAIVYPNSMYNLNIISAKGRSDLHMKLEVIKKGAATILLIALLHFGMWGMIISSTLGTCFGAYINALNSGKMINYPIKEQLADIVPILSLAVIVGGLIILLDNFFNNILYFSDFLRLLIGIPFYFIFYFLISYLLKLKPAIDFRDLLEGLLISKRKSIA